MSSARAKDHLLALIASEFCGGPLRVSLESLGLVRVDYQGTERILSRLHGRLPPERQGIVPGLVNFLLDLVRHSRAINSLELIDLTDETIWGESRASSDISWALTRHACQSTASNAPAGNQAFQPSHVGAGRSLGSC